MSCLFQLSQQRKKINKLQTLVHGSCMLIHKLFLITMHENLGFIHATIHGLDFFKGNHDKAMNIHACLVHVCPLFNAKQIVNC